MLTLVKGSTVANVSVRNWGAVITLVGAMANYACRAQTGGAAAGPMIGSASEAAFVAALPLAGTIPSGLPRTAVVMDPIRMKVFAA